MAPKVRADLARRTRRRRPTVRRVAVNMGHVHHGHHGHHGHNEKPGTVPHK